MHPVDMIKDIQHQANVQFINLQAIQRNIINPPEDESYDAQLRMVGSMIELATQIRGLCYALTMSPSINDAPTP